MTGLPYRSRLKRVTDVGLAAAALVVLAPVVLVAMTAVRLTMGSPIFFVQVRTGFSGRPFRVFKIRTMRGPTDAGPLPESQRLSPVGHLLRRTSIDELPQLLNVLRGDMSLVGPRPLLPCYDPWYTPDERLRFTVRPGLTGLAQVYGRNFLGWDDRLSMDARYVREWSYRLDLRILARTIVMVLRGSGVAMNPRATMLDLDEYRRQNHPRWTSLNRSPLVARLDTDPHRDAGRFRDMTHPPDPDHIGKGMT